MTGREPPVLVRLRSALAGLPAAERRVADLVLADPPAAARATVVELARAAGTSTASVVRLCQRIGYRRSKDFQLALGADHASALSEGRSSLGEAIEPGDPLAAVVQKVSRAEAASLVDTALALDVEALERAVDAVAVARRVDVFGVGASSLAALDLHQKLTRIGRTALVWTDPHMAWTSAATLDDSALACAVSHSGRTPEAISYLQHARAGGATTLAITSSAGSPLAREADVVLLTAARETEYRAGAMGSRIAQLMVVDCLFIGVARLHHEASLELLARTYAVVGARRVR
ncbi:MurR/RpiR family transcriptional regulator [Desertihabitans aurantiacus]|uniref:MurR/RpiR family transcriptional regulator n=1 Tax=Desertihabitans aurantiacus TaxID=2282477 RepID=UPI000DF79481|nr:MurR/RpiR family transcriptional regulator [Desertihabitans aurantiacus]